MCRPPDVLTQLTAAERRSQLAAQLFGSDDSYNVGNTGSHGQGATAGGGWDGQSGGRVPQAEGMWQWQQPMAASGMSPALQAGQKEVLAKKFGTPGLNRGTGGGSGKASERGRKAGRQSRSNVPDSQSNPPSSGISAADVAAWKASLQRNAPQQTPVLSPWGAMVPAMAVAQVTPPTANVMTTPSLGGNSLAALYGQQMIIPNRAMNASWTPQGDNTENLDQWLQETVQFPQSMGQTMPMPSPMMKPQMQTQPWGMTADPFEMSIQENQVGTLDPLDMDDDEMDNDDGSNDKKIRRMLSNRASAKRSRQRRQERLGELEIQTAKLRVENTTITRKYHEAIDQARRYQQENEKLRMDFENLRKELEMLKMGGRHSGVGSVKQESGNTSAHSAATAVGGIPRKEEIVNEAHSYRTMEHRLEGKLAGIQKGNQVNDDECSMKVLDSPDFGALLSCGQSVAEKKVASRKEELETSPKEPVKEIVKLEQCVDNMSPVMGQKDVKVNSSQASGVSSPAGLSTLGSGNPGSPSNDICDLDGLGLPAFDTGLLEPDNLGDEWFQSLVQCMDE